MNKVREASVPGETSRAKSERLETARRNADSFLTEIVLMIDPSRAGIYKRLCSGLMRPCLIRSQDPKEPVRGTSSPGSAISFGGLDLRDGP